MSYQPRVVCAAMKMDDGLIITGVRHFSPDMRATLRQLYGEGYDRKVVEQGFIDTRYTFLSRREALEMARRSGQPLINAGGNAKMLFSEHLY